MHTILSLFFRDRDVIFDKLSVHTIKHRKLVRKGNIIMRKLSI